jgi:ATP-dependent exoDNAse (exonuclease V) beta subunit
VEEEWLDAIPAEDAARLREFCRRLSGLRAIAPLRPLDDLVERTMNAFEYDLALLARPGGAGRMANVRKLMRLAGEFEEHEGRDLRAFLDAATASTRRDEREGMAPVSAEDHDGVRIMTVHAAKGLEFPVVAVPDLGRALSAGHRYGDVALGSERDGRRRFGMRLAFPAAASEGLWDLEELLAEERDAEAEEGCRLVYVAATRARSKLILSGIHSPATCEPLDEARAGDTPLRRLLPELVSFGWRGGDARLALPAPGGTGEVGLRVLTSEPTPERAERLRVRRPPAPAVETRAPADGVPPLLDGGPRSTPVGHLSYSALDEFDRCGYRFYIERVLGVREASRDAAGEETRTDEGRDELPDPAPTGEGAPRRELALGFGNAVHAALEWSARHGWAEPGTEHLRAVLEHEGLGAGESLERAQAMISGWLRSSLRGELEGQLRAEAPFALPLGGGIVRGKIDLLAESANAVTVLDYKTDALAGTAPADHGARYATQRAIYALAVARGELPVRAVHLFLDAPDDPVVEVFDEPALAAARARLEGLVGAIREGEFAPTTEPTVALCFGCPAAARLCSRPAWTPSRA